MEHASILLVTEYDGGGFAGWQRQPDQRTVQGEMERVLHRLCGAPVNALAAGRTDAGVHARGQGVGVRVPPRWSPAALRRAMNALLPRDVWIASAHAMVPTFHPRFDARTRRYRYFVGLDERARSPFRRRTTWALGRPLDLDRLSAEGAALPGEHCFRAFAVAHTAPATDDHRCRIHHASWTRVGDDAVFEVEANRFLHHMVRFLVGTMVEVATGRRPAGTVASLLAAPDNARTAPPAPPEGLFFEAVTYPASSYLADPEVACA
jgi:tRNA pseudouridine38-40 synthase